MMRYMNNWELTAKKQLCTICKQMGKTKTQTKLLKGISC